MDAGVTIEKEEVKTEAPPVVEHAPKTPYSTTVKSLMENKPAKAQQPDGKYDEKGKPPNNIYKPKEPFTGKVIFNETIT